MNSKSSYLGHHFLPSLSAEVECEPIFSAVNEDREGG